MGHQSQTLQETSKPLESEQTVWPGRSPLTSELLAPDKELTEMLDYEDLEENDLGVPDPEIAQAVAHIPQADAFADAEMQESQPPPGFEPEVSRSGYDINLVRSNRAEPGQWKTRCWMERPPEPPVLAGRVPRKTPAVQRTINFWGLIPRRSFTYSRRRMTSWRATKD